MRKIIFILLVLFVGYATKSYAYNPAALKYTISSLSSAPKTNGNISSSKLTPVGPAPIPNKGPAPIGYMSDTKDSYTVALINIMNAQGVSNTIDKAADGLGVLMFILFLGYIGMSLIIGDKINWGKELAYLLFSLLLLFSGGQYIITLTIGLVNDINNTALGSMSGVTWFFGLLNLNVIKTSPLGLAKAIVTLNLWKLGATFLTSFSIGFALIFNFLMMFFCKILIWIILGIRNVLLIFLWAFAPIIAALSIFPPYRKILVEWVKEVIIISSWKFGITLSNLIIYAVAQSTFKNGAGDVESVCLVMLGTGMIAMTPKVTRALFDGGLGKGFNEIIKTTAVTAGAVAATIATAGIAAVAAPAIGLATAPAAAGAASGSSGTATGATVATTTATNTAGAASTGTTSAASTGTTAAANSAGTTSINAATSAKPSTFDNIRKVGGNSINNVRKTSGLAKDDKTDVGDNR